MFTKIITKFAFCTSRNYTSTFKIRSRLSQFFKHVHPDQLTQAPTKVKEENLKSLTNFNSYIDSINQARPVQAKLLKFYIAEKSNNKSKKFFSFTVQLPQISQRQADMTQDKAKKLVDNIVEVLNRKFVESKNFKTKKGKQQQKVQKVEGLQINQKQTQQQRFQRMSATIKPFNTKSRLTENEAQMLKSALNTKYMQAQRQSLSSKLKKTISFADKGMNKPMMWSRIATEQSGIYKDYQSIMDELIDPRLIYFDESLETDKIEQFKKRLLPGQLDRQSYKASKIILEVCSKMQSFEPPICFYVSNKYSSTQIPGFLTIPYNFKAKQLAQYFQKQIDTVIEQQQKYEQFYDYYMDIKAQLKAQNNLIIDQVNFKNNTQIWQRILMLKRLQKYRVNKPMGVVAFDKSTYDVFKHKYNIASNETAVVYNNKIMIVVEFNDEQMQKITDKINSQLANQSQ